MKSKFHTYFFFYLLSLFFFSLIYLYQKHEVGNDSTVSEWFINYAGGFTKRGVVGHIVILIAETFKISLRDAILFSQISIISVYYILIFQYFKNIDTNRVIILSILSPIFVLYPVAEIEVLARKEVFIFCIFIIYTLLKNDVYKNLYKVFVLTLAVLIWEPVIFFFAFFLALDIFDSNFEDFSKKFYLNLLNYLPSLSVAFYIAFNPISPEGHEQMSEYLLNNFDEVCYMSCYLLRYKSSLYEQFSAQFDHYSLEVILRYFLIILIGFGPMILLSKNSKINKKNIIFFKNFENLFFPFAIMLSPVIILFAMGYDWGRWVNISYVFSIISFIYIYKNNLINLSEKFLNYKLFKNINKKIFIFIFIIFCFGWNPKTVITGDVASFPGYRVPYKVFKILSN